MTKTYFTSDTHFNHLNILQYCNRPFTDIEEMNKVLIENWNSIIGPNDLVYHLGDFAMGERHKIPSILSELNGKMILIRGNHEKNSSLHYFDTVKYRHYIEHEGKKIELIHNPYHAKFQDVDMVFCGHIHEQFKIGMPGYKLKDYITEEHSDYGFVTKLPIVNVGVDVWDFKPISIEQIFGELENAK